MIVKVGDIPAAIPLQPKKEAQKTSKKGLFNLNKGSPQEASSLSTVEETSTLQKTSSLAGLMHLQEIDEAIPQTFSERGEAMLSHLEVLRQGLLRGTFSQEDLETIKSDLLSAKRATSPAGPVKEVLELIEQRVHIELAKIEMS